MIRKALIAGLASLCVLGAASDIGFDIRPRLLYNPSESAPIGWYAVEQNSAYRKGDRVAAFAPAEARELAHQRQYLPRDYPLIKTIMGVPGERFCAEGQQVKGPDGTVILRLLQDRSGRDMHGFEGCLVLPDQHYFIVSPGMENGWDSRYFGAVPGENILGTVRFLGDGSFGTESR